MRTLLRILFAVSFPLTVTACMWDAESLSREKSRSHDLAQTILGTTSTLEDTNRLRTRIKELESDRHEDDVMWWNNLAGAHLRLNEAQVAATLLEPIVGKFPNDYGIHANLGTAYHLLGRYQDAEKEIARDLEINPDAHFGLEKYHLALLQYLVRDPKYQARHVYVDEFTAAFLATPNGHFDPYYFEGMLDGEIQDYRNDIAKAEADYQSSIKTNADKSKIRKMLAITALVDSPPIYRAKWDIVHDTNLVAGVIYMGQMNPKEPACFTMLGIVAWKNRDYHLAVTAFDKAIALGSLQSNLLKERVADVREFIHQSEEQKRSMYFVLIMGVVILVLITFVLGRIIRWGLRVSK
jgi:hypothetical protein